ncbi:hypothetical protein MMC27_000564 [Xylographa pallens]|nr:hypothetical protein [Xylographa pallens]
MVGEGFNPRPPSWDQGFRPENVVLSLELLDNGNNLQAMDEDIQTEDSTSPVNFLHRGNNLQALGSETSNHTTPHGLLPELWYTPEELQYTAHILPDSSTDIPHDAFTTLLDCAHGGSELQDLRGKSYTSMAPDTLMPELDSSPEEVQYNHEVPSGFNSGLPHDPFVTSPDTPHNDSDLTFMDSSDFIYSSSDLHTFKSSKRNLCSSPRQLQSCGNDLQAFDNSLPPEALVSPFNVFQCQNYQQNSKGESSIPNLYACYKEVKGCRNDLSTFDNSLPPKALVSPFNVFQCQNFLQNSKGESSTSNLCASHQEFEDCSDVLPAFDNSFPSETFVDPFDFFHYENDLQTSKGESSTSMASHTHSSNLSDSPGELQSSGSNPSVSNNGIRPNAFEFGPDFLRSNVSFRGFGNETSSTAFARQDQIIPYQPSASHLKSPYSGHNFQARDDEIYSSGPFHHGQTLPRQTNEFHTISLDSDDEWQTMGNITSTPAPVLQDHFFGHALTCIFSGNDFRSLIRVAESWPSASFLDISPKNATTTDSQATPAVKYGVVIPTPWKNSRFEGLRPANRSPLSPNSASIWRKDSNSIRAYSIVPGFNERWVPHIEYEGIDMRPKRMVIGSPSGVSLILSGSLSFGGFTHREISPHSSAAPSKILYEERFLMAGVRLYGVAPKAKVGII